MSRFIAGMLAIVLAVVTAGCSAHEEAPPSSPAPMEVSGSGEGTRPKAEVETAVPTPAPAPAPTPEPTKPPVSPAPVVSDAPNDGYFDRTLFIGDSIMEGIRQYVAKERKEHTTLGEAKFLATTVGISLADLVGDRQTGLYYRYKGEEKPLEQIVSQMEADRIFLLLGLNDLAAAYPVIEEAVARYSRLIDLLRQATPEAEIIVLTNPPKVASSWLPPYTENRSFGNELIDDFVAALVELCDRRGIPYIDVHAALENEDGVLSEEYCRDGYVHLSDAGSAVVVEALYAFAADKT